MAEHRGWHSVAMPVFALAHRDHASVGDFANHVLELDGGVVDVKLRMETFLHVPQDALTDRRRNVGN